MIVAFAPGGSSDVVARVMAQHLGAMWGQQVIVDNRPGASGMLGHEIGARAPADGYTIVLTSIGPLAVNPSLYKTVGYDPVKSFEPVTLTVSLLNALVVHPSVPASSVKELIAYARARPGQVNYGSSGVGGAGHLAGELFGMMAGVKLTHVPYKGMGPATIDLMGGQIDVGFDQLSAAISFIKSGRTRALALASPTRSKTLPALPTLAESGVTGADASTFTGILAPAKTPGDIVARLSAALMKSLKSHAVSERFDTLGAEVWPSTPGELGQFIKDDLAKWSRVVRTAGIKVE
jgi:tripartite-type tricarboxylate transporter receptor subunit TctC